MPTILVIQHVPHERLGNLEAPLKAAGCVLRPLNAYDPKAAWPQPGEFDGIVVMGGPQSVYEQKKYPYLAKELALLRDALKAKTPILGVCLGSQLLAEAIGGPGTVHPADVKEIGWYPVMREPGADGDPMWEPFGQTETVFQWHGDTFALPKGAVQLASSPLCDQQAFRYRDNVYALQFHLEVSEAMIRAWMMNPRNRKELASLKGQIDPMAIRRQSPQHAARIKMLCGHVAAAFAKKVSGTNGV